MAGAKVVNLVLLGTHSAKASLGHFVNELVRDTSELAKEVKLGLAILVAAVRSFVIPDALEVGHFIFDRTQGQDSFHDEFRRVSLDSMAQSEKPTPERKQIPQRRHVQAAQKQHHPDHECADENTEFR